MLKFSALRSEFLSDSPPATLARRVRAFLALTKPRVVSLIVFTAVIGMLLATPGMVPLQLLLAGTAGIALVAGAAAAVNCLVEQKIDARMQRTSWRPLPRGELTSLQTVVFAGAVGGFGLWLLLHYVNALTMWLTLATFVGYAVVYTLILKPLTPQNIVIGGASGAMPPVLGWAAVTGEVTTEAMLLFLIIFAWTPPHFWSLALYRTEDYARAGVPMLPVTHGKDYTRLQVLLYTLILKPLTPQNIVIGGASGAMPPVLGWAAVTGEVTTEAMLLFLIIFAWTPPHFWSLALYRTEDYARAGVPMLPVTHGKDYTRLQVLLYTLILFGVSLLPYVVRMSGLPYLAAAVALGLVYIGYAVRIHVAYSDRLARSCFRFSIVYLAALFAALLVDHYLAL